MAFKKKIVAEWQIQETEMLMRKSGCLFIRPMTLEKCGKSKYDFIWLDDTIGNIERKESDDE